LLETVPLVEVVVGSVVPLTAGVPPLLATVRLIESVVGGVVQLPVAAPTGEYAAGGCWRFHGMGVPRW
jgi:hypothetical protein